MLRTPIYSLPLTDDLDAAADVASHMRDLSTKVETALQSRGVAAPLAPDLLAVSGRVTTLENKLLTTWTDLTPLAGSYIAYTTGGYATPGYRIEDRRVYLRGWVRASAAVAAGLPIFTAPVAVAARPSNTVDLKARDASTTAQRLSIGTDGVILNTLAIAVNAYIALDGVSWPLG